jgi:hypothetical protein
MALLDYLFRIMIYLLFIILIFATAIIITLDPFEEPLLQWFAVGNIVVVLCGLLMGAI